jgi:release factor glutamine methyltransferase
VSFLVHYARASGVAVDISEQAIEWAKRNVMRHGLADRCRIEHRSWNIGGRFDVVFSNPPYLTAAEFQDALPEIGVFEPETAFIAGCDGLAAYRELGPRVARLLKPAGLAFIEIGKGQEASVKDILVESRLNVVGVSPDLAGIPRCVIAVRPSRMAQQKTVGKLPATR